ncbi:hypothetical protein B0H17DRAFT_1052000 [Mycena rosella]|uniref:Uncharacterized protein n=1 Tax=Mycena rosella TaxID=1033263 RepID=A0AAD7GP99_MYCRO|nr:hypothetical protein B0H17DRAFT_1052000 [Mycena rosella]
MPPLPPFSPPPISARSVRGCARRGGQRPGRSSDAPNSRYACALPDLLPRLRSHRGAAAPIAGVVLAGARGMVDSTPLIILTPADTRYTAPSPRVALYRPCFSCSPAAPIATVGLARARDMMGDAYSVLFMLLAYHFVHSLHLFFVHLAHTCFWFFRLRNMYLG